jgi:tartrate dehydratase alpha subunit/fumarate hydratase class I-like protein
MKPCESVSDRPAMGVPLAEGDVVVDGAVVVAVVDVDVLVGDAVDVTVVVDGGGAAS